VETGAEIISENSTKSLIPASNLKLLTTGAALGILGETYQFETSVGYVGKILDSVLIGNILIKGSGDPSLGSDRYTGCPTIDDLMIRWASKIKTNGIKAIKGSIVVDASVFEMSTTPDFWPWGDLGNYYGAGTFGLNLNENLYRLYFTGGGNEGDSAKLVKTMPAMKELNFVNHVLSGKVGSGDNAYVFSSPRSSYVYMKGTIPAKTEQFVVKGAMPNPPKVCGDLLKEALMRKGVEVQNSTVVMWTQAASKIENVEIDRYYSPPLKEIVKQTNVFSINLNAEVLLRVCGLKLFQSSEIDQGIKAVQLYWKSKGVAVEGLFLYDGSGLSPNNGVPPSVMSRALCVIAKDSIFNSFYASMPIAGKTGTVYRLGKGTAAEGNMRVKSGTLRKVICYSGYFKSKSGKMYSFSLMSNNYTCSNNVIISKLEKIMIQLAEMP